MTYSTFEVSLNTIPIDYAPPPFPSLYLPVNSVRYNGALLFYHYDVWRFTVYWTLIFFAAFHGAAALWACLMHRRPAGFIWILLVYVCFGGIQAFISGSIVGLFVSGLYRAGTFGMTTWVPFVWGATQILFQVIGSYSMMSTLL
ncbi:uncharacterized protein SAPINGB_P001878 [Magnusiomyces paraingens]|uniref:Integral membrane protein n=1 Tax=Magnusiomyces paraingens TaxID=2606893 RepID=A0A5E8BC30_9ASCO|nr:uncharacterized protein SAPINGB_P001878 [Saprochaete ingens]VVT48640.1 unnamed protein product [Saprochaete ingens]